MIHIFFFSLFLSLLSLSYCFRDTIKFFHPTHIETISYPHFQNNPYLNERYRLLMTPYLLPLDHPVKSKLDAIFSKTRATESEQSLLDAGFSIIANMPGSFVTVARHPEIPGFVLKLYLDSETRSKKDLPNYEWLTKRCIGAATIRKIIKNKNLHHFSIPDKWLYVLPLDPPSQGVNPLPVLVVETDMELEDEKTTELAWKTVPTPEHLKQLHTIIKHGYGTVALIRNIPRTKNGTFAFTDTEYPTRKLRLVRVKPYLSEEMQEYWDELIGTK